MDLHRPQLSPGHQVVVNRFVSACEADERVVAALLVGSYAKGTADVYSDLDLYLLTTDEAYDEVVAGREAFVRLLGEPVFLDDFGSAVSVLFILSDGTEGELGVGCERQIRHVFSGPYTVLLDKKHLLSGAVIPWNEAAKNPDEQVETLRRQIYWFWHDLSHFVTAMGRGQLWWAYGQLEALRLYCVNLTRLGQNFSDSDVGAEGYFKLDRALSVQLLSPLQATICPMEPGAMLQASSVIVGFYRDLAPQLARTHGIQYPMVLDRVISYRLEKLRQAHWK